MKNLTSITEHSDWLDNNFTSIREKWELHRKRVEFGKQKLELWQFVPAKLVNGVWVVLEEPKRYVPMCSNPSENLRLDAEECYNTEMQEYQQAKEKFLFEGFELKGETESTWIFSVNGVFPIMISKTSSIETLPQRFNIEFILTATAKKDLNL